MRTARLETRYVSESDRDLFVELFTDDTFMVFSDSGTLNREAASRRFDHMVQLSETLPFCKQALIELSTGAIVGYVGADYIDYRGQRHLEFGYRLIVSRRGQGYATEASTGMLEMARQSYRGELLGVVDPRNDPSRNVLSKLGFRFVERLLLSGADCEVHSLTL